MKSLLLIPSFTALALLCSSAVHGQTVVRETATASTPAPTEVVGTVAELRSDSVFILNKDVIGPVSFYFAKKVEYVDAAGNPVAREVITPGVPVTIRYIREGDQMLVDRVIVQHPLAPAATTTATATVNGTTTPKPAAGYLDKEIERLRVDGRAGRNAK